MLLQLTSTLFEDVVKTGATVNLTDITSVSNYVNDVFSFMTKTSPLNHPSKQGD